MSNMNEFVKTGTSVTAGSRLWHKFSRFQNKIIFNIVLEKFCYLQLYHSLLFKTEPKKNLNIQNFAFNVSILPTPYILTKYIVTNASKLENPMVKSAVSVHQL